MRTNDKETRAVRNGPEVGACDVEQGDMVSAMQQHGETMKTSEQVRVEGFGTTRHYSENNEEARGDGNNDDLAVVYEDYPLLASMIRWEKTRRDALKQPYYVKGTDGWFRSMFVVEGRAIDRFFLPWVLLTLNAAMWTIIAERRNIDFGDNHTARWLAVYTLGINTSLAFLLVFRLNRVAIRYWETRTMWGNMIVSGRCLVSSVLEHVNHSPKERDRAIAWTNAFAIASMHFIRGEKQIPMAELAGILSRFDVDKMEKAEHAPLYAASQIRKSLKTAMNVTVETPIQLANAWAIQLNLFETQINTMIAQISGMERIRSTPLPLVYVTHLRTFLFVYLLSLPYVWAQEWGWGTIPICSLTSFALLGIEGASSECEVPFTKNRLNHLALDTYCLILENNIQGLLLQAANDRMEEKAVA